MLLAVEARHHPLRLTSSLRWKLTLTNIDPDCKETACIETAPTVVLSNVHGKAMHAHMAVVLDAIQSKFGTGRMVQTKAESKDYKFVLGHKVYERVVP